jgi:hypothetical protein
VNDTPRFTTAADALAAALEYSEEMQDVVIIWHTKHSGSKAMIGYITDIPDVTRAVGILEEGKVALLSHAYGNTQNDDDDISGTCHA